MKENDEDTEVERGRRMEKGGNELERKRKSKMKRFRSIEYGRKRVKKEREDGAGETDKRR